MNNQTNINPQTTTANQFAQPAILEIIGATRVAKFLDGFTEDLKAANISLPIPESANGDYFDSIAALLASPALLPDRLRVALSALEAAASPENAKRLDTAIQHRIPCVSINPNCPLDCALELWFAAPDELVQFGPSCCASASSSTVPGRDPLTGIGSEIQIPSPIPKSEINGQTGSVQRSKIENPLTSPPLPRPNSQLSTPQLSTTSVSPWPEPVNGQLLLDTLAQALRRFVVLPIWAAETLALWIVHTFAFELRDVCTYIGVESPEKQCGKTTLLTVLCELTHRAVTASNISPPAFFRVIEDLRPTLLIDEADTFLRGNEQLKGILNAGYKRKTAFVLRAGTSLNDDSDSANSASTAAVNSFSCWCPKLISQIGHIPGNLADRCIIIRMQRKTRHEQCERLRNLDAEPLKQQCARFVLDHQQQIATARPEFPAGLSDRASDIWEPLLAIADLAGGDWPEKARQAAVTLSATAQENNPFGSLLMDIFLIFASCSEERVFSRILIQQLVNNSADRPWAELRQGKPITELWLSQKLRPYGIYPRTIRIGEARAKGYSLEDFKDTFQRYLPKSELQALVAEAKASQAEAPSEDAKL